MDRDTVLARIDRYRDEVIELQRLLVATPALSPDYGEAPELTGESRKVELLRQYLVGHGITDITLLAAPDERVPGGVRPNLIARIPGRCRERTVWVMAHSDVVPPGDLSKWSHDPYALRVDGDLIYGRGVEDNHQGLVAGVMAARAFLDSGVEPAFDLGLLIVADEECGSKFGIQYVLEAGNPLRSDDLILVPDGGVSDGGEIEVAEKGILWLRLRTTGSQTHASTPEKGRNAMRAGAHLVVELDRLHRLFDRSDPVFSPPISTFEPTKKEANVPNVNTIPGDDVFYLDCRVLPVYDLADVEAAVRAVADEVASRFGVTIGVETVQRGMQPPRPRLTPRWSASCGRR